MYIFFFFYKEKNTKKTNLYYTGTIINLILGKIIF